MGGGTKRELMGRGLAGKGENGGVQSRGRNLDTSIHVEYNPHSRMSYHNRAHIFEKATESTHNGVVFSGPRVNIRRYGCTMYHGMLPGRYVVYSCA